MASGSTYLVSDKARTATRDGSGNIITSKYVTIDTAQTITGTKSWGTSGAGGQLNGAATDGGINSILIGNDVWLGDCNTGGILGMKSTGANTGFYFYNSSGTQTCQLYTDGTRLITNKPLNITLDSDVTPTSSTGSLVIGSLTGLSIGIDANEIMCRSANAASTLYLQNEGGGIVMGANTTINAALTVSGNINNYKLYVGGAIDANDVRTTDGIWICNAAITNAPITYHGALFGIASVGTPCQFYMPDMSYYVYKRYYTSSAWTSWTKIYAGYADSSGSCTGNSATATRINGALGAVSDSDGHNIWVSSTTGADGIPRYVSGVYIVPSSKTIVATTFAGKLQLPAEAGFYTDEFGNFYHKRSASSDNWTLRNNAGSATLTFYWETGVLTASQVKNAVWNDYAECRKAEIITPGYVVTESPNKIMIKATERLMPGCKIVSDTYGTCMGETSDAKTPIAVAGRVLAYPYRNKNYYSLGAAVCSAPGGTVDIMTREEIRDYPERIVGTVSEIPDYEIWHGGNQNGNDDVIVNGRIWIYVK